MEESNVCLYKFELHLHNSMSISNCKKVNTKRVLLPKPDNAEINLVSNYKLKSILFIHSGYVCMYYKILTKITFFQFSII